MKSKRIAITLAATDRDGICAAQQAGGAGALTLNGVLVSGGAVSFAYPYRIEGYSGGNIAAKVFTVTGTDQNGAAQTDTVTGISGGVVATTKYFMSVSSITVDASFASDVEFGAADEVAYTLPLDIYTPAHAIACDIGGTINYSILKCYERLTAGETANWVADGITTQTTDQQTTFTTPIGAIRIVVNSYSTGATIATSVLPARYV